MELQEKLKAFAAKVPDLLDNAKTEEATKTSLVMPFFNMLGYNVFDPTEFCPEYTADVGIKKKEKVDYAILNDGEPAILVECKPSTDDLSKHGSQLFRYFSTTSAKFAILTNGVIYKFYTDLDETNKMDLVPFMEFDLLNMKDQFINELAKFEKSNYDQDKIFSTAEDLKYSSLIKEYLKNEMANPSEEFVRLVLTDIYDGVKNQKVIEKYTPLVKRAFNSFVNDLVNQKISSALTPEDFEDAAESDATDSTDSKIITTESELESFYIVRGLLAGIAPVDKVHYRDTESYFGILYDDNNRKPICRLIFGAKKMQIQIPDENKSFTRYYLESLDDIYKYKNELIETVKRYI